MINIAPDTDYPKLRPLDVRPQLKNGQPYFLLNDPLHLSEHSLLVPQPWAAVLALMDGMTSVPETASVFSRRYGVSIAADDVQELVNALDEVFLLDNDRAREARQRAVEHYRSAPHRPVMLAGRGYPESAAELGEYLDDFLADIPDKTERADLVQAVDDGRFGLLSPHIDYTRGGSVYAQVWQQSADAIRSADLVILLGTDHYGDDPFTLTRQHYATPYGVLPTAQGIVDELASALGEEQAYAGELRHRGEHSLELVAVWLHHMRRGEPVEVVPILVGSLHRYIMNGDKPNNDQQINRALHALHTASKNRRVAVIASGDLSHVGAAFGGDPLTLGDRVLLRRDDDELIDHMRQANPTGFFNSIQRMRDRNNVCGVSPIYLTLRLLDARQGELHGYAACPADEDNTSAVTICGMVFR